MAFFHVHQSGQRPEIIYIYIYKKAVPVRLFNQIVVNCGKSCSCQVLPHLTSSANMRK